VERVGLAHLLGDLFHGAGGDVAAVLGGLDLLSVGICNAVHQGGVREVRQQPLHADGVDLAAGELDRCGRDGLNRLLGKELCVLAWAVERLEPEKIRIAVRNWLALRPEQRWWLFAMTAIATDALQDAGKSWRLALRYALGDVAQNEPLKPRLEMRKAGRAGPHRNLGLFDDAG
jgi:hypothetical protein